MKQVAAAIIRRQDTYLIARRAPDQPSPGKWEFPGGKVEPGETPEACLKRELLEELGIDVTVGDLVATSKYTYPGGAIELLAFDAKVIHGGFELRVHDRMAWVPAAELLRYDLLPADIPIASRLHEMRRPRG